MSQPSPDAKAVVRAAEALTTQVRRIADALSTTAVRYEVAADDTETTPVYCPLCPVAWKLTTPADATAHFRSHHPEQRLVGPGPWPKLDTDDDAATPATTWSARYAGALAVGDCIRAAGHISDTDHTDASGRYYGEKLAVYPTDSTVRVAHWHPIAEQLTEERQELASMVGEFVDAQVQHARAAEDRLPCPYCGDQQPIPRRQLVEHIARLHPDVKTEGSGADEDDAVAPTCWHTEPGSPCDWDRCHQPERLAAGDQGVDPATTPSLGPKLRAADEEGTPNMLRVLADRSARGVLSPGEGDALRRRVEQLIAGRETWKAKAEEIERDRDQHAAVLREVLGTFTHETHPGRRCLQSGHINVETVEQWRSVVAPTAERPWWEQVALYEKEAVEATRHVLELKAAIERVHAVKKAPARSQFNTLANAQDNGWDAALHAVHAALDGTEQPTTEQPEPPTGNLAAYQAAIARVALVLREEREHREQTDPSERQDCVMCGADHFAEIRDAIKGKSITTEGP